MIAPAPSSDPFPPSTDAINTLARQIAAMLRAADVPPDEVVQLGATLQAVTGLPQQWAWLLLEDLAAMLAPAGARA